MNKERIIDVRKQANLSARKTLRLCLRGISHRMLRSVLTLAVVGLAVAFFMFLLSENAFVAGVAGGVGQEIREQRLAARTLNRLYNVPSSLAFSRMLSQLERDPGAVEEVATVLGWDTGRTAALARDAATEIRYLAFFDSLRVGNLAILVGRRRGREILRYLGDPAVQAGFRENIRPMLDVRVPGGLDTLLGFTSRYALYYTGLSTARAAWGQRLASLQLQTSVLRGDLVLEAHLAGANDAQLARWQALVQEHGFRVSIAEAERIRDQLAATQLRQRAMEVLLAEDSQDLWRQTFRERRRLSAEDRLVRLDDARAAKILPDTFSRAERHSLSRHEKYSRRIGDMERNLASKVADLDAAGRLSGRQIFLLLISFLVCTVGIANAMLMSITERFREIATMKCLGATDRYILFQFMMEAALQGVAGGVLGMGVGFVIASLKSAVAYGGYILSYWPGLALTGMAAGSLLTGVLLAVLASMYPAWAASRMAPMEAMRVE